MSGAAIAFRPLLVRSPPARFGRSLVREVIEDDVTGTAAEMAYRFLFALFPLLLFTAVVLGAVGGPLGRDDLVLEFTARIRPLLPQPVALNVDAFVARLETERSATFLTIGVLGTLWGASGGLGALIKGLNRAYDVARPRPTLRRQLVALTATVLVPPLGVALLLASVVGHSLAGRLGGALGISGDLGGAVALGQAIAALAAFSFAIALVYRALPAIPQRWQDVLPGTVIAAIGWTVLTQAFGVYVARLGDYQVTYGSFAGAIAFLLWLYLVSVDVLIGAEVNALLSPAGRRAWSGTGDRESNGGG